MNLEEIIVSIVVAVIAIACISSMFILAGRVM